MVTVSPCVRRSTSLLLIGFSGLTLLAAPAGAATSDPRAVAILQRAAAAAHLQGYAATQYVSTYSSTGASSSVVLTVRHDAGEGSMITVASPSGAKSSVWSSDNRLAGTAELAVQGLNGGSLHLLQQTYSLELDPDGSYTCVLARRADGIVAARFWIDHDSGLVVRREVYDASGRVVRASALLNLELTGPQPLTTPAVLSHSAPLSLTAQSSERKLDMSEVAELADRGWALPRVLPGQLVLYDVRMQGEGDDAVVHLSYSDGLSTLSLFEQRGRLDASAVAGWRQSKVDGARMWWDDGAVPSRAVWSSRGRVWTVLTDLPVEALTSVVSELPHDKPAHRGFWARLGHGLARLASWINPFD